MLDQDFCSFLEYQLTKALANSTDNSIKGFWCDGILLPASEKDLSKKYVNDHRQVSMTAYIGKDGQDKYELVLNFGSKSLSRYVRGLDIKSCVPKPNENDWYYLDLPNKVIIINMA